MSKFPTDKVAGFIRYSTDIDLEEILLWLQEQNRKEVHGTFFCNRNIVIECHNENKLIVFIDTETNKPIAYQLGELTSPGILEVRVDKRGQGVGKKLVEYRIKEARDSDKCLLRIQCEPESSITFWEHMGFQLYERNYAYMLLDKKHVLPEGGVNCQIKICFFPEERKWNDSTPPIKTFTPIAVKNSDGFIYLSNRIAFFNTRDRVDHDTVISIHIEGEQVYLDKAKYEEARELDVKYDNGTFYLDRIKIHNNTTAPDRENGGGASR